MNLLGMKLYTVHVKANVPVTEQTPVFVKEGFSIFAFMLHFFWALYHRLWAAAIVIFLVFVLLVILINEHVLSVNGITALQLGFQFLVGAHGNDWIRTKLAKQDYILADIAAGDSMLRAEQRYFERMLAA